jgi:hypothetical protein
LRKLITESSKFGRGYRVAPVTRQGCGFDCRAPYLVRNIRDGQNQVIGRVVFVEVDEILQQREGLVFRGIASLSESKPFRYSEAGA